MATVKLIIVSILFVISSGSLFSKKFQNHKTLVILASLFAIIGTYYLLDGIYNDLEKISNKKIEKLEQDLSKIKQTTNFSTPKTGTNPEIPVINQPSQKVVSTQDNELVNKNNKDLIKVQKNNEINKEFKPNKNETDTKGIDKSNAKIDNVDKSRVVSTAKMKEPTNNIGVSINVSQIQLIQGFNYSQVSISPDAKTMVIGGGWKESPQIWNLVNGKWVPGSKLPSQSNWVHEIVSWSGGFATSHSNNNLKIWTNKGKLLHKIRAGGNAGLSVSDTLMVAGSKDHKLTLINYITGEKLLSVPFSYNHFPRTFVLPSLNVLALNPNKLNLAIGDMDKTRTWRIEDLYSVNDQLKNILPIATPVGPSEKCFSRSLTYSKNSKWLAGLCTYQLWIQNLTDNSVYSIKSEKHGFSGLSGPGYWTEGEILLSPDGRYIIFAENQTLRILEVPSGKILFEFIESSNKWSNNWDLSISGDGKTLVTSCNKVKAKSNVRIWNIADEDN